MVAYRNELLLLPRVVADCNALLRGPLMAGFFYENLYRRQDRGKKKGISFCILVLSLNST